MGNKKKKDLCKIKEKIELEIMPLFGVYIYALLQLSVACLLNHFVISSFLFNPILYKVKYLYIEKQFNKLHVGVIS